MNNPNPRIKPGQSTRAVRCGNRWRKLNQRTIPASNDKGAENGDAES